MDSEHLEAYLAGELDENGRVKVERALRHDSHLRTSFLIQAQMEAALKVLLGPGTATRQVEFDRGVIARLRSEGAGDHRGFAKSVLTEIVEEREKLRPIRWPDLIKTGIISAAASIALLLALQAIVFRESPRGSGQKKDAIAEGFTARVEQSDNVKWAAASKAQIREDGWLTTGFLKIESGSILIAFNSGATAVVEGPSELSIESGNRMFLKSGRLSADVPPAASGFTVNTPRLNAIDIGTRFGVTVEGNGDSELHVMQGKVEVSRASGNSVPTLVVEGLALRADSRTRSELKPIPYAGERFRLRVGNPSLPEPALRYAFDESTGTIVEDSGTKPLLDVPMITSGELDHSPRRSSGRSGGGLVFQPGETLDVSLSREFKLEEPHTIAFWVKLPPKIGRSNQEQILQYGQDGLSWEISCNLESGAGVRGALKVDCPDGYVIGSTDLGDGNWHHVAYRFIGGAGNDIATHLQLFVDGKPETISDYRSGSIKAGRAGNLRLGSDQSHGFQGWIDDLTLFREAVSTQTIQQLND
ncbi:MAG: FecR domain-containing protein [Verrucomicrobiales bacterium]|nr:FecR domain-containing protein [Verrucomicrobiales bacterium]